MSENDGLERFIEQQEKEYELALKEIKNGEKISCWMWYIFPQIKGLGKSSISTYYGIKDIEEAIEYLKNENLKNNLLEISQALLDLGNVNIKKVMGFIDDVKLQSCMTLFNEAELISHIKCGRIFQKVLTQFFNGEKDKNTLKILEEQKNNKSKENKEELNKEKDIKESCDSENIKLSDNNKKDEINKNQKIEENKVSNDIIKNKENENNNKNNNGKKNKNEDNINNNEKIIENEDKIEKNKLNEENIENSNKENNNGKKDFNENKKSVNNEDIKEEEKEEEKRKLNLEKKSDAILTNMDKDEKSSNNYNKNNNDIIINKKRIEIKINNERQKNVTECNVNIKTNQEISDTITNEYNVKKYHNKDKYNQENNNNLIKEKEKNNKLGRKNKPKVQILNLEKVDDRKSRCKCNIF